MEDIFHLGIKALIKNKNGDLLLLRVNKGKLSGHTGEEYWDIPGGRVQAGQSIENTLRREVEEETGISDIEAIKHITMVLSNIRIPVNDGDVGLILSIYECNISKSPDIQLSEEHTESAWFEPSEAAKLLEFKYPREFTNQIITPHYS